MRDIQNYNMEHVDTLAPDTIKESVMCRHSQLSLLLADIQGRISNAPEGSLRTARKAHGCQYYHKVEVNDTKGTYIKKHNYNFAIELAQKDYDLRIEQCLLKELNFLEVILKKYNPSEIQHIYDSLNSFRKEMVTPVFVSDEDFTANWKASEYTSLGFPYRYEYPLQLQSGIITHPDFTCLNVKTRQEYIWEHFGIMDNAEYACNAIKKISDYANSGYVLGRNFIATFETANTPINANCIDSLIKSHLC